MWLTVISGLGIYLQQGCLTRPNPNHSDYTLYSNPSFGAKFDIKKSWVLSGGDSAKLLIFTPEKGDSELLIFSKLDSSSAVEDLIKILLEVHGANLLDTASRTVNSNSIFELHLRSDSSLINVSHLIFWQGPSKISAEYHQVKNDGYLERLQASFHFNTSRQSL